MSKNHRPRPARRTGLEALESRQVMSADPLLGSLVSHGFLDEPQPLVQHVEPPALVHHLEPPDLVQHGAQDFDFSLDPEAGYTVEDMLGAVEKTLNSAHGVTGLDTVRANYGFTGAGQTVAIIDSGIAYDHFALGGGLGSGYRVVGGWDFTENDADPYDDGPSGSHGTHVAGIVGSTGDANGNNVGVAPGVDLVGLRVFNDAGNGSFSWVESALQWVIQNRTAFENPITAVNLSLGTSWNGSVPPAWAMLEEEFAELKAAGVFISVSAGNDFASFQTPGLSYPAASPHVVPVMSIDDSGSLSNFSQRHTSAIAAPGRQIRSTVPDFAGNHNGITDDWANFSGTSMAAPYVAGASVLIREAMEFVGYTTTTQDIIYDHMRATADSFFDSATSQNYLKLNLGAAIDALMPADDYGSTADAAYWLGTVSSDTELSGLISTLDDADYFSFTAGVTGTVTVSAATTHNLVAAWDTGGQDTWQVDGGWAMNVVAGQTYTIGLSSSDGLGYYDLTLSAEASFSFVDWSTVVGQQQHQGIANSGETWYRIVAGQSGFVTTEAFFNTGAGNIDIALYDANQVLLTAGSQATGGERIDYMATAGEELFVRVTGINNAVDFRITNQVAVVGATLTVSGTAGNDMVTFTAGATYDVSIAGVAYSFAAGAIDNVLLDGGGGANTVEITGSTASETFTLSAGTTTVTGGGYALTASNFLSVLAFGGGGAADAAVLHDTAGDDQLTAWHDRATFVGSTFFHEVRDFGKVTVFATAGYDKATFYDTDGDDTFTTWWDRAVMYGDGYWNDARGFDETLAFASGGYDNAVFRDTPGDDTYSTWWNRALMYGDGYWHDARGFDHTIAYSTGGNDKAMLRDTNLDDTFTSWWDRAVMYSNNYWNEARNFGRVFAFASGGNDKAVLRDSPGDDTFTTWPDRVVMYGDGFWNDARGFDQTFGFASAGNDRAVLRDSAGDDVFTSWPDRGVMQGPGFSNDARNFDRVEAFATTGNDQAIFYDSAGNDTFSTWWDRAIMFGDGYWNEARGFDQTNAYFSVGFDRAVLRDSDGLDQVHADGTHAYITDNVRYRNEVDGFDRLDVYDLDGGGADEAYIGAVDAIFNLFGNWTLQ